MSVLVGVDAGASHTEAVASDESLRPLGRHRGLEGAMHPGDPTAVANVIGRIVSGALNEAGLGSKVDAIAVGAAGAGRERERAALEQALAERLGSETKLTVTTDAAIALQAAFGDGRGIVLCAGTGSIAYARDPSEKCSRVGGLGWQLGDEGSGYALAQSALAIVGRAWEGRGPSTALSERLAAVVGAASLDELVRWTQAADHTAVAGLARHVCEVAREGDRPAREAVQQAARDLVALVDALLDRFSDQAPVRVAMCGGLLSLESPVRAEVVEIVEREMPTIELIDGLVDPPLGALALAAQLLA